MRESRFWILQYTCAQVGENCRNDSNMVVMISIWLKSHGSWAFGILPVG